VIVICDEGYQSSLAAATLRRFGVDATDVIGGVQAWIEAGLPVQGSRARPRRRASLGRLVGGDMLDEAPTSSV
jgi:3-mercaptopyruvate sulfurtransferase SseA